MDESPEQHHQKPKKPRRTRKYEPSAQVNDSGRDSSPAQSTGSTTHEPIPFGNPGDQKSNRKPADSQQAQTLANPSNKTQQTNRRTGPRFNAHLTDASKQQHPKERVDSKTSDNIPDLKDDLTTRLIRELNTRPYPDCAICFNSIHPTQPTWSCSPSYAIAGSDPESSNVINENAQCCWTTFHLKCIHSWASKTVKGVTEALRARGEERECEWLCPACRAKRLLIPSDYRCFCGYTVDPKPPRFRTAHSCGNPCSRRRKCGHSCPISCHPGPCPPCQVTIKLRCYCTTKIVFLKCFSLSLPKESGPAEADLSCGNICAKKLQCGNHSCSDVCHPGECKSCEVRENVRCYCGKNYAEIACGKGLPKHCEAQNEGEWLGSFKCTNTCARTFECGLHQCSKTCHPPPLVPSPCPLSPSIVKSCPCGKHMLSADEVDHFSPNSQLIRISCSDPIPTCNSMCMKALSGCSHVCSIPCHTGPCPPCSTNVVRPCRCGAITMDIPCYLIGSSDELLCTRRCSAFRACGKHRCDRICCPLASFAAPKKGKVKRRTLEGTHIDDSGWHICDLICGKLLACGNHSCEERDHSGPCAPCLRSSFVEMSCHCGRTVLDPPISCGTHISCTYPCDRPPLSCGHPKMSHACHEDPIPCPPCPILTSKICGCGKMSVDNVKCSQEKVSCGTICGKLMKCGFHQCKRSCHTDDCGPCQSVCGKPRKLCAPEHHPCTDICHAPSACSEAVPCKSPITLSCPCGRIQQPDSCGRSISHPSGVEGSQQRRCTSECEVAKRNARLAEALGISSKSRADLLRVNYSESLINAAKADIKACIMLEKSFADFIFSNKKMHVLPHIPKTHKQFVKELATVYRVDTQIVDQEPHRSVQLIRRIDSRVPKPLLSIAATSSQSSTTSNPQSLGKLVDLRSSWRTPLPTVAPKPSVPANRGWTSSAPGPDGSMALLVSSSSRGSATLSRIRARTPVAEGAVSLAPSLTDNPVPDNWEDAELQEM